MDSIEESSCTTTTAMPDEIGRKWTNEMHMSFLDRMEASFVRKVLFGGEEEEEEEEAQAISIPLSSLVGTHCPTSPLPPPLDRYLPDSTESTLDSHVGSWSKRRWGNRGSSMTAAAARRDRQDILEPRTRKGTKTRRLSCPRSDESDDQDQVVPLFQSPASSDSSQEEKV